MKKGDSKQVEGGKVIAFIGKNGVQSVNPEPSSTEEKKKEEDLFQKEEKLKKVKTVDFGLNEQEAKERSQINYAKQTAHRCDGYEGTLFPDGTYRNAQGEVVTPPKEMQEEIERRAQLKKQQETLKKYHPIYDCRFHQFLAILFQLFAAVIGPLLMVFFVCFQWNIPKALICLVVIGVCHLIGNALADYLSLGIYLLRFCFLGLGTYHVYYCFSGLLKVIEYQIKGGWTPVQYRSWDQTMMFTMAELLVFALIHEYYRKREALFH